ncbi:MAG: hypothetical protein LBE76_02220 [Nitrososphaerota archaeon]|jgi:hypothetical protein|nr:hypothetical protein [Nitrososphaerota archaeon]
MNSQNRTGYGFEEKLQTQTGQSPLHQVLVSGFVPQFSAQKPTNQTGKSLPFKIPEHTKNISINKPIHDYTQRIKQNRHNIQQLPNGQICYNF